MTGPEHYREAERLIRDMPRRASTDGFSHDNIAMIQRAAQVHATLALAAAMAVNDPFAWYDAIGIGLKDES